MSAFKWSKSSLNLVVTASNNRIALRTDARIGMNESIRVHNIGTNIVYIALGTDTVSADSSTTMSLAAGGVETFSLSDGQTHLAAIAAATGNTLNITVGQGI